MYATRNQFRNSALRIFLVAGAICGGVSLLAGGPARPAPTTVNKPCMLQPGAAGPALICPPVIPPNVEVDTNSEQVIYGHKTFAQPVYGNLQGTATYADEFTAELDGDVAGPQGATRVVSVPAAALPSIGFGPLAAPRLKYVLSDADPNDPRMNGSIAHPYTSLAQAAAGAAAGDRFIVQGVVSGWAVFNVPVSLEGAGPDQTFFYGMVEFAGNGASRMSGFRVNCSSSTACVVNRAIGDAALFMEDMIVYQAYDGSAAASQSGPIIATESRFVTFGGGVTLRLELTSVGESRLTNCEVVNARGGIAIDATGGSLRISNGAISTADKGPAIALTNMTSFAAGGAKLESGGPVMMIQDSREVYVHECEIIAGGAASAVSIQNADIATFAAANSPGLLFTNNVFVSDTADVFQCEKSATIRTRGNLIPGLPDPPPAQSLPDGCMRITFQGM